MNTLRTKRLLAWAVSASLPLLAASAAQAQYATNADGHALDANNRVGSGGRNDTGGSQSPMTVNGNQIVTGDVSGGRQFRGFVPYTDPTAFRGGTAGSNLDRFVAESSGVPSMQNVQPYGNNNASGVHPFYGDSRAAPPPAGYTQQGASGGFVPTNKSAMAAPEDMRLGKPLDATVPQLPVPGELTLPGPVDPTGNGIPSIGAAGASTYGSTPGAGLTNGQLGAMTGANGQPQGPVEMARAARIQQMQNELRASGQLSGEQPSAAGQVANAPLQSQAPGSNAVATGLALNPQAAGQNGSNALSSQLQASALDNSLGAAREGQRSSLLVSPAAQSSQYNEMRKRFEASQGHPLTDQQSNELLQQQIRQQKQASATKQPGGITQPPGGKAPAPKPGAGATAGGAGEVSLPAGNAKPANLEPLKVNSLADGITAKGLGSLFKQSEDQMRQGKFSTAVQTYDTAAKVAPNNPLTTLGRAHAELGAGYYLRAERDIRRALDTDPALLVGQYDLKAMMGDQHVDKVTNDLKKIATDEPNESRPVFLLAYIAYNTGDAQHAADWLDVAEKRAGGHDTTISSMRQYWKLPAASAPADLNK